MGSPYRCVNLPEGNPESKLTYIDVKNPAIGRLFSRGFPHGFSTSMLVYPRVSFPRNGAGCLEASARTIWLMAPRKPSRTRWRMWSYRELWWVAWATPKKVSKVTSESQNSGEWFMFMPVFFWGTQMSLFKQCDNVWRWGITLKQINAKWCRTHDDLHPWRLGVPWFQTAPIGCESFCSWIYNVDQWWKRSASRFFQCLVLDHIGSIYCWGWIYYMDLYGI